MDHIDQLIQIGGISGKSKLLDLGCGNGMIAEYISELTGAHLTGIDFIPLAIRDTIEHTKMKRDRIDFYVSIRLEKMLRRKKLPNISARLEAAVPNSLF